ncbi:uncharacterized protein [Onthophagus taurus]|uniref:uncharacterized protein n=1 Tax=Onthophagus taurus TaxID=166361 RepID=UPI0039BDEA63
MTRLRAAGILMGERNSKNANLWNEMVDYSPNLECVTDFTPLQHIFTKKYLTHPSSTEVEVKNSLKIYTDGSKRREGAGAGVFSYDLRLHVSEPLGISTTVIQAELIAIQLAAAVIVRSNLDDLNHENLTKTLNISDSDLNSIDNLDNSTVTSLKRQVNIFPGNPFFNEPIPDLDLPDVLPTLDLEPKSNRTKINIRINKNDLAGTNITKLIEQIEEFIANQTKFAKQEVDEDNSNDGEEISDEEPETNAEQEDDEESEEEESNESEETDFVQGLIKSFLGQLSTPEGGVDVDAIVGLIGGLSVPKDDGTYDFSGLTETLQSFLDPGEDGMGSDVGAFLGGLVGAFIQGVARPPGAKGSGILAGNLVAQILPALSAPAPMGEATEQPPKQPNLDIGSFLGGFIKTFLGASGNNNNNNGNGQAHPFANIKQTLFKSVFSGISSIFVKPSGASSNNKWK